MLRTLTRFGLAALLLAAFAGTARTADPTTDSEKIDAIYKALPIQGMRLTIVENELKEMRLRVEELERRLRIQEGDKARIARAFNPSNSGPITLHNRTAQPATIILDGISYTLAPYQMLILAAKPVGPVTYEVFVNGWGVIQPPTTRMLAADRPFSVFVNP